MSDIGTITELEPEDGLGWIENASGERIRFGGTACKGFVPAIGMTVEVLGTKAGYGGTIKATEVRQAKGKAAAAAAPKVAPAAAAAAAAAAPRTHLHTLQSANVGAEDLLSTLIGRADVDDALHADLVSLKLELRPSPAAGVECNNPWLYVIATDGAGNAYGLYTHPLLAEHDAPPWACWNRTANTVRALATDTASFLQGFLATAKTRGGDPAAVERTRTTLVRLGMSDEQGQPFGEGEWASWLPPSDEALRPLSEYIAESDGAEMERGLLAYASRRGDAEATEALNSLYVSWEWKPPS